MSSTDGVSVCELQRKLNTRWLSAANAKRVPWHQRLPHSIMESASARGTLREVMAIELSFYALPTAAIPTDNGLVENGRLEGSNLC